MEGICKDCRFVSDCEEMCPAFVTLYKIADAQIKDDRTQYIRSLANKLDIVKTEKSAALRRLGNKIIKAFAEFSFITEWNISIGYVMSQETKSGMKVTYADCRKVDQAYRAYLPFDFVITFYERYSDTLSENQQKILMYHELKHIGMGKNGYRIVPHDIEDFKVLIGAYGMNWNEPGVEVPDILDSGGDTS